MVLEQKKRGKTKVKNRLLRSMIGISAVMLMVSGCGSKEKETEPASIELASVEVVGESETETESETESESEIESESKEETEIQTETEVQLDIPNETERETKTGVPVENLIKEPETKAGAGTEATPPEQREETVKESESETEAQTRKQTEKQSENKPETEAQTRKQTEKQSENKPETEAQTRKQTEKQSENKPETEGQTRKQTEKQSENKPETEAQTRKQTEKQSENKPETEKQTEAAVSTEKETEETPDQLFRVVNDVIIVRQEQSVESGRLAALYPGDEVLWLSEDGEWSNVLFKAEEDLERGYVKTEFLTDSDKRYVAKEKVNVRKERDKDSEKLGAYLEGEPVLVEEQLSDGWAKVRYLAQEKAEVVEGYVRSEYLQKSERSETDPLVVQAALLAGETIPETEAASETEPETTVVTEAETEPEITVVTEAETEPETTVVTEAETESETTVVTETETEPETKSETVPETEAISETESKTETTAITESETETTAITESETEPNSVTETAIETETEVTALTETETISVSETEVLTEAVTEATESSMTTQDSMEAQFRALKEAAPEASCIGILYAKSNAAAPAKLTEYETLAKSLGYEIQTVSVEEEQDIDFAASSLVGEVDAIFCISDPMIDKLLDTVYAYAQEVEIPVINTDATVMSDR